MHVRLHAPDRHAHQRGHVLFREIGEVAEAHGLTLSLREACHGGGEIHAHLEVPGPDVVDHGGQRPLRATNLVDGEVGRHARHPRLEPRLAAKSTPVGEDPSQRLGGDILSSVDRPQDPAGRAHGDVEETAERRLELVVIEPSHHLARHQSSTTVNVGVDP